MQSYGLKTTRTRLTMRLSLMLICVLVSAELTLIMENCTYSPGPAQGSARTVYRTLQSTEEQPEEDTEYCSQEELDMLCRVVYGEAGGCSPEEQALVVGCVLNRVKTWNKSIEEVVTEPYQFIGYSADNPITDDIQEVVESVLDMFSRGEPAPELAPYTTSPNYLFFYGDGTHNWFREEF